eukprot:899162-Karenia_brevis.AAC.1
METVEEKIKKAIADKKIPENALVVISADRADGKRYKQGWTINLAPCLTTTNNLLIVMSTHDIEKPKPEREFFRKFLSGE